MNTEKTFEVYELIRGVECSNPMIMEGTEDYVVKDLCFTYGIDTAGKSIERLYKDLSKEGVRIVEIEN